MSKLPAAPDNLRTIVGVILGAALMYGGEALTDSGTLDQATLDAFTAGVADVVCEAEAEEDAPTVAPDPETAPTDAAAPPGGAPDDPA